MTATLADLIAAAELGAVDTTQTVLTSSEADAMVRAARHAAETVTRTETVTALPDDHHACGIDGCRHGAAHTGPKQPDRQVKLACPTCGAVARMTARALATSHGIVCAKDGATFAEAARRAYGRNGGAA